MAESDGKTATRKAPAKKGAAKKTAEELGFASRLIIHGHSDGRCTEIEHDMPLLKSDTTLSQVADAVRWFVQKLTAIKPESVYIELVLLEPERGGPDAE